MTAKERKDSYWTSLPGILTGGAAIITAVTSLYIATSNSDNEKQPSSPPLKHPSPIMQKTLLPNEWPLVDEETFFNNTSKWQKGSFTDETTYRFDLDIVEGKYRWDVDFKSVWERRVVAPFGSATDFYLAVDVKFVDFTSRYVSASLLFGRVSNMDFAFRISPNQTYALNRFDGKGNNSIINWSSISIKPKEFNRIAVSVENQKIMLYINSKLVGTYKDYTFTGGKVGLSVAGYQKGISTVIDFDNFEFRRKP